MSFHKKSFFLKKELPSGNDASLLTLLHNACAECLSVLNQGDIEFIRKVDALCKLWQIISMFTKENSSTFDEYVHFVCQSSLVIMLDVDWESELEKKSQLLEAMQRVKQTQQNCNTLLETLVRIYDKPWGIQYFDDVVFNDKQVSRVETEAYFVSEQGDCLSERIKSLCSSGCEDYALKLIDVCRGVATGEQGDFLDDLHFMLLCGLNKTDQLLEELKGLPVTKNICLVNNLVGYSKLTNTTPTVSLLLKFCDKLLASCLVIAMPKLMRKPYSDDLRQICCHWMDHVMKYKEIESAVDMIAEMADMASSSAHLYVLSEELNCRMADQHFRFCTVILIRALTANVNELENGESNQDKKLSAMILSEGFSKLGELFKGCDSLTGECAVAEFSLHPTHYALNKIKKEISTSQNKSKYSPETSIWKEGAQRGLSEQDCNDINILISASCKHSSLSWSLNIKDLLSACREHMSKYDTVFEDTKLNYLAVDYSQFDHIPRPKIDEYEGIEKGYERYLTEEIEAKPPVIKIKKTPRNLDPEWENRKNKIKLADKTQTRSKNKKEKKKKLNLKKTFRAGGLKLVMYPKLRLANQPTKPIVVPSETRLRNIVKTDSMPLENVIDLDSYESVSRLVQSKSLGESNVCKEQGELTTDVAPVHTITEHLPGDAGGEQAMAMMRNSEISHISQTSRSREEDQYFQRLYKRYNIEEAFINNAIRRNVATRPALGKFKASPTIPCSSSVRVNFVFSMCMEKPANVPDQSTQANITEQQLLARDERFENAIRRLSSISIDAATPPTRVFGLLNRHRCPVFKD